MQHTPLRGRAAFSSNITAVCRVRISVGMSNRNMGFNKEGYMKNRIITIRREFGSGGRTIGKMTAKNLDIPCYDQELIAKLVEKSGFTEDYVKEYAEYAGLIFFNAILGRTSGPTSQDKLWIVQRDLICELAERGPCVIVGRCADFILRDKADCLNVFVHASLDKRAERIVRVYGEREERPEMRLRQKDRRREAYYQIYTDMKWGDMRNYHLTLDSGALGLEKCTEILTRTF